MTDSPGPLPGDPELMLAAIALFRGQAVLPAGCTPEEQVSAALEAARPFLAGHGGEISEADLLESAPALKALLAQLSVLGGGYLLTALLGMGIEPTEEQLVDHLDRMERAVRMMSGQLPAPMPPGHGIN